MEIVITTRIDPQLYRAVASNAVKTLGRLADADNSILLQTNPTSKTLLHIAAQYGHKEVAEELCRRCTSLITAVDSSGSSPLHEAAYYGHFQIVEALIRYRKMAPESSGSANGQRKSQLQEMLEMKTSKGCTALHWAVRMGHLEVVKVLTNEEPGLLFTTEEPSLLFMVDNRGSSPLGYAAAIGHMEIVDHILSVPINRDRFHRGVHGRTPLHEAIWSKHYDIASKLMSEIPEYATSVDNKRRTPLHVAVMFCPLRTVQMLLEVNSTALYYKDEVGDSPIHVAAWAGRIDVYREIIERFPDLWDMTNNFGWTVLHVAVRGNQFELVQYILETTQHIDIINARDKDGDTALHLAVIADLIWVVFLFLDDKRVNVDLENDSGYTPVDIVSAAMEWGIPFSHKVAIWLALTKASTSSEAPSFIKKIRERRQKDDKKRKVEETWKTTTNTLLVVVALISTVSFAAIFTLPGGYEDSGSDQGFAHFRKKTLFQVFLLLDALAMFSSMVAAILVIVANLTDYLGLKVLIPWALKLTSFSFISMSFAFSWALGLMTDYTWALVLVSLLNAVIFLLTLALFGFNSPAYLCWRVYVTLRRVRKAITRNCGIY